MTLDELSVPDEELARRVRDGDESAAGQLYGRYVGLLRRRARRGLLGAMRRKVGDSDVVQETYLAVFRDLADFEDRGPGSFRRWLESILSCRVKESVRHFVRADKRAIARETEAPGSADEFVAGGGGRDRSPSSHAAAAEMAEKLRHDIDLMEGDDRFVLRLIALEWRDYVDVATLMGRSPEAVRKLYARAVVRLGKRMSAAR